MKRRREEEEKVETQLDFSSIGIQPWLDKQLDKLKIKIPTIIQEKCIPETLKGKDIIGMSQTGTGKTAAFALPILQTLARDMFGIYALIVTPTRELAHQIKKHFEILAGDIPLRIALIVGGLDYLAQAQILESKPHIVIGTPGRIEACMRLNGKDNYFKKLKYLVFDEADRILDMEFSLDVELILKCCNPKRQTLLYSATLNEKVQNLAQMSLKEGNIFMFNACPLYKTADNLEQFYLFMPKSVKDCYLYELISTQVKLKKSNIVIVFCSLLQECEILMNIFNEMGIKAGSLHGAKPQKERIEALNSFRKRKTKVLFCTDVANRGLDIPSVSMVVNYDLPDTTDKYVHRVGRTARCGQFGVAVNLISQYEVKRIQSIEKDIKVQMEKYQIDEKKAEEHMYEIAEKRCKAKIKLIQDGFAENYNVRKTYKKNQSDLLEEKTIEYQKKYLDEGVKK